MDSFPFKPRVAGWELTLACNMNCIHCGSSAGKPRADELTEEEGCSLIDQLVDLGLEVMTLSGGEPMIHPSWYVYAKRLSDAGVKTQMITNGLLLKDNVQKVYDSGIRRLGVSMDGMEETHNFIRNNPISFKKALEGIEACTKKGIVASAITHISKANINEMEAMYNLFKEIGVTVWQIQITFKMGRMKDHEDYALDPEQLPIIAKFVQEKQEIDDGILVVPGDNLGYYGCNKIRNKPWKGCFAGRHLIGIDADGTVKGCLSLPREVFSEGNIRKETLKNIWQDENRFKYNRYFSNDMLEGNCKGCPKGESCRAGCVVTAYSSTGNRFDNPYCLYRVEGNFNPKG